MAESPIRFGIIGCAEIARKVARAISLAPNATLYAVASRSLQKARDFAAKNNLSEAVKIYESYDQLLDDPCVDAVHIPLPTSLHLQWAVLAANKKKHLLLEKPTALDVAELDRILDACESNGVQFMDGSMWLHHPRTATMKHLLSASDSRSIGTVDFIHSTMTMSVPSEFLRNDVRVKPDLDALGALGDVGWYCIGASLWAMNYRLPNAVTALPDVTRNAAGVILSCTASLEWKQPNQTVATIHCSFLSHMSMDLAIYGSNGCIHLKDFVIPFEETGASFELTFAAKLAELHIGWNLRPEEVHVATMLPQETLMVQELASLIQGIRKCGVLPSKKWPEISRKTQLVVDAVKKSIELGCKPINL